jgi:hypothetical protein
VSRRQNLLAEGVDPADLSVFGAALTQDLSPSKRVTNAAVAVFLPSSGPTNRTLTSGPILPQTYKEQFLLSQHQEQRQQQQQKRIRKPRAPPTREESLMSIADAICPPGLRSEIEPSDALTTRLRGHSVSLDDD